VPAAVGPLTDSQLVPRLRETASDLIDAITTPKGRDFNAAWEAACLIFGRFDQRPTLLDEAIHDAGKLWDMLDDIDTLDDACRDSDRSFRAHVRHVVKRRFSVLTSNGHELNRDGLYSITNESRRDADAVPQPDGGASGEAGDVHGLGEGWVRNPATVGGERWDHAGGAQIISVRDYGWLWFCAGVKECRSVVDTAREAAALALGTLPTPAPAVVAGELDWEAIERAASGCMGTRDIVESMLCEYDRQLTTRLAALEARR
jgi:hypothetical protein